MRIKTTLGLILCVISFSSLSQRKVYRVGETTPAAEIAIDSTDNRPQKVRKKNSSNRMCDCNNDLSFDPTTNIALDKNKPGKPPYTGKCVSFFSNKKPEMQLSFLNGIQEGMWIYFYESGNPKMIKNYEIGRAHV